MQPVVMAPKNRKERYTKMKIFSSHPRTTSHQITHPPPPKFNLLLGRSSTLRGCATATDQGVTRCRSQVARLAQRVEPLRIVVARWRVKRRSAPGKRERNRREEDRPTDKERPTERQKRGKDCARQAAPDFQDEAWEPYVLR